MYLMYELSTMFTIYGIYSAYILLSHFSEETVLITLIGFFALCEATILNVVGAFHTSRYHDLQTVALKALTPGCDY